MKRTLSILLAVMMLFSVLPTAAFAAVNPQLADTGTTVGSVSLYVNAPVAGQPASYFADPLSSSANYYVNEYNGGNYKNGVQWFDVTNNSVISTANTSFRWLKRR